MFESFPCARNVSLWGVFFPYFIKILFVDKRVAIIYLETENFQWLKPRTKCSQDKRISSKYYVSMAPPGGPKKIEILNYIASPGRSSR